jgi:hypothetical protein
VSDTVDGPVADTDEDITDRLARLEAYEEIRSLAARYAQSIDARDIEALVGLFVDDVPVGGAGHGRAALAEWFDQALRQFTVSFHLIGNHLIELVDADHAAGTLYCRPEHQVGDQWIVMPMQYRDTYERQDGVWYFRTRAAHAFYATDILEAPSAQPGRFHFPGAPMVEAADLPEHWPSWQRFWSSATP